MSPKALVRALQSETVGASDAQPATRSRGFSLSKVFGPKKLNKDRSHSLETHMKSSQPTSRLAPHQPGSPPSRPLNHADLEEQAAAARRQEYALQLHAASAGTSYLPMQSQAPYYRHRVNEPYAPSARFAAALSMGFSPTQANSVLSIASPLIAPPTKYGMPRLPRGTLNPEKLIYLDYALSFIAAERCKRDLIREENWQRMESGRAQRQGGEEKKPFEQTAGHPVTGDKPAREEDEIKSALGLENLTIDKAHEHGRQPHQVVGANESSSSCASTTSSYLSVASRKPRPTSMTRSDSQDSSFSSATSQRQGRTLANLASDEGGASTSSSDDTNETEVLLDEKDLPASKCTQGKTDFERASCEPKGSTTRRESRVMSGIIAALTNPAYPTAFMQSSANPVLSNDLLSPASTENSGAAGAPSRASGSVSSSIDNKFIRRSAWSFVGRRRTSSQNKSGGLPGVFLGGAGTSVVDRQKLENGPSTGAMGKASSAEAPGFVSGQDTKPPLSPRSGLLSLNQTKNRLGLAFKTPA